MDSGDKRTTDQQRKDHDTGKFFHPVLLLLMRFLLLPPVIRAVP
jgi:hypothetical protein